MDELALEWADRAGVVVTRIGLIVVLLWIGGLKAFK
jgi:reactive chlorine resistance protein C